MLAHDTEEYKVPEFLFYENHIPKFEMAMHTQDVAHTKTGIHRKINTYSLHFLMLLSVENSLTGGCMWQGSFQMSIQRKPTSASGK